MKINAKLGLRQKRSSILSQTVDKQVLEDVCTYFIIIETAECLTVTARLLNIA